MSMAWNEIPPATFRADGYVNMLTRYGTLQDSSTAYQYRGAGTIPDNDLTEQYESNGLFSKIIDIPAEEAIKHGFDLGLTDTDASTYITDKLDHLDWEEKAATALKWTRLYGGALGVLLIDDGRGIDEPVNWQRIKNIEEIRIYERACVWPDYSVMYDFNNIPKPKSRGKAPPTRHGMPEHYYINSVFGQFWVHESRCLIFRNGILPERTLQPNYRFWGTPEYVRIKRELRETATSHSTGVKMLERSVQAIFSMKALGDTLAADDGMEVMIKRLQAIDMSRGILNSVAIDADGEEYGFEEFSLSGVKDVIDTTCNMLSAVTNIPQTILFGRSPAGMNATGESDLENWYNYIERIQKLNLRRNLQTLLDVIVRVGISNGNLTGEPDYKLKFNPLWSMTEEDEAKVKHTNAQIQQVKAQTAKMYFDMGVLDPSEIRKGLAQEGEFQVEELLENIEADNFGGLWGEDGQKSLTYSPEYDTIMAGQKVDADESDGDWITINGTRVPVGKNGELQGEIGGKIMSESNEPATLEKPTKDTVFSASGANSNIPAMTEEAQRSHKKHTRPGKSYPGMPMDEYVRKSGELARSPIGGDIDGYRAANGSIIRYNRETNDWVRAYHTGVATMFKPKRGLNYFNEKMREHGGVQDD